MVEFTLLQRIKIRFGFPVYVGHRRREGWRGSLPFYAVYCSSCNKIVEDYPHGFKDVLECPVCGRGLAFRR